MIPGGNKVREIFCRVRHWQVIAVLLMAYDIFAVNLAYFLGLWFRYDCRFSTIGNHYLEAYFKFVPLYTVFCVAVFWVFRLYKSIWRFASYTELIRTIAASVVCFIFHTAGITLLFCRMPISYYLIGPVLQFLLIIGVRFSYRFILLEIGRRRNSEECSRAANTMIIGAGAAGIMILGDIIKASEINDKVCCIIDDNPNKWKRFIEGIPVVGGRDDILSAVEKYKIEKILFAIPSATPEQKRDILNICKETGCEIKSLPGVYQMINGDVTVSKMKKIAIEDLLGRDPIKVNMKEIFAFLKGKTILVTGGGGSIGSELCRQIAGHSPAHLIIFDVYENNAYDIEQELMRSFPGLKLTVLIGSVRDSRRINNVFEKYRPDVVYHAAAHKHVPLMETSPCEAIKNNVIGTYKTAYAALMYGCKRFVLISTDKAVNPTNVMGASKRLCEMIIQSMDKAVKEGTVDKLPRLFSHSERADDVDNFAMCENPVTEFAAVRFGNVLGSNGSVVPLFKRQIEQGGPVTVTHPDIIRYFMTIPEAVSLVLQAGANAGGGEIFVLDMGAPVKIDTLARNLIKLSGYKPDVDIKISYTGLRPGEKLYEEKLMSEEGLKTTENKLIFIGSPIEFDTWEFMQQLGVLMEKAYNNSDNIRESIAQLVSTYNCRGDGCNSPVKDKTFKRLYDLAVSAGGE